MSETPDEAVDAAIAGAEAALRRARGGGASLHAPRRLTEADRRNLAVRAVLREAGAERSVVVKRCKPPARGTASLDLLGPLFLETAAPGNSHAPAVLAAAPEDGLIVLEDLGDGPTLVTPLLHGTAAEAEDALLALARRLGRLHADTVGARGRFDALQARHWPGPAPRLRSFFDRPTNAIAADLEARIPGIAAPRAEFQAVAAALAAPGPFLAYTHGDACPDNVFITNGTARLIDFEFGRFGHALLDAIYFRIGFPTCWCAGRCPAETVARCEAVYRAEVACSIPAAADDTEFHAALAHVGAAWVLMRLEWMLPAALESPSHWGISTRRARLLNDLDAFASLAERAGALRALGEFTRALRRALGERWPETEPLPLYPAFRDAR